MCGCFLVDTLRQLVVGLKYLIPLFLIDQSTSGRLHSFSSRFQVVLPASALPPVPIFHLSLQQGNLLTHTRSLSILPSSRYLYHISYSHFFRSSSSFSSSSSSLSFVVLSSSFVTRSTFNNSNTLVLSLALSLAFSRSFRSRLL